MSGLTRHLPHMSQLEYHWMTAAAPTSAASCQDHPPWLQHLTDCAESRGSSEQVCCSGDQDA